MNRPALFVVIVVGFLSATTTEAQESVVPAEQWPQFRGPGGSGSDPDRQPLPIQFGPDKNVVWKTALPVGHSSPCLWDKRIFLTGFDQPSKKLETLCLDRDSGKILWRRTAPAKQIEKVQKISNPATATPVTDGKRVYVYFASYGLLCYDFEGEQKWALPLPMPKTRFGTGSSPILVADRVIVNADFLPKPYLLAVRGTTGEVVWKKERLPSFEGEGYATPFLWKHDGTEELIVVTASRILAFVPADGRATWTIAIRSTACTSPTAGGRKLFVSTWAPGGEPEELMPLPSFAELLKKADKNKDGKISRDEFPKDLYFLRRQGFGSDVPGADIKMSLFFDVIDKNKDGYIDSVEWSIILLLLSMKVEHGVLAIEPGGKAGTARIAWKHKRSIPEVASPLYYQGLVYLTREGGIVSCLDEQTGEPYYKERLGAAGPYFASPIAGDGKVYAVSYDGTVSVLAAGKKYRLLARNELGEHILATPAAVGGRLYVRTEQHLYAFGESVVKRP